MSDIQIGGLSLGAPPINNACLPNIYDKLDADVMERTRVRNKFVDYRQQFYEKIIEKHRKESLKVYLKERNKLVRDVKRIAKKTPYLNDIPYLETQVKLSNFYKKEIKQEEFKAYSTETRLPNGMSTERESKPFCDRYFDHHVLPRRPKGMRKHMLPPLRSLEAEGDFRSPIARGLLMSQRLSASENCIASRTGHGMDGLFGLSLSNSAQDDDAITV